MIGVFKHRQFGKTFDLGTFFLAFLILTTVCGCKQRPSSSQAKIVGGLEARADEFVSTVALHNSANKTFCTGTVIGTKAVLTAQHCLGKKFPLVKGKKPKAAVWHRAYDENVEGVYDLAILVFDSPLEIPASKTVTKSVAKGTRFIVVGYGCSELGEGATSGKKRYGTNTVSAAGAEGMITFYGSEADQPTPGVDVITCSGDSGGPLFVDNEVLGVTSGGDSRVHVATGMYTPIAHQLIRAAQDLGGGISGQDEPPLSEADRLQIVTQLEEQ